VKLVTEVTTLLGTGALGEAAAKANEGFVKLSVKVPLERVGAEFVATVCASMNTCNFALEGCYWQLKRKH
jgi:hypothetical protein